ncbi:MAG: aspartate/glutamate racemase family protein [Spirochaetes bacterium]|nr:aspartate/glutamate racemase family protein [Spirochaetota bacterium]
MKTIGIIAGLSWESSIEYYRLLNIKVQSALGGVHSARIIMTSVDFQEYSDNMKADRWDIIEKALIDEATKLKTAGADAIAIATNTMHVFADAVENNTGLPLVHIADAAGKAVKSCAISKVGLLGTKYSMEKDFYSLRLAEKSGIETIIPLSPDRERINGFIMDEFCRGIFTDEARSYFIKVISDLESRGAKGIILGCTEIPLLIKQDDVNIRLFDTMALHIDAITEYMLQY